MIFDAQNLFSDDQAITATAVSTNAIDLGLTGGDCAFAIAAVVKEDFNTLTSLTIDVEVDSTDAFSSAVVVASRSVLLADLVEGASFEFKLPANAIEQYMRLNYTVVGTPPTTGAIFAGVVETFQSNG